MRRTTVLVFLCFLPFLALIASFALTPDVGQPAITTGQHWPDLYFTGPIDIESRGSDPALGFGATAEYTLDACPLGICPFGTDCSSTLNWLEAAVDGGLSAEFLPFDGADGTYGASAALDTDRFVVAEQRRGENGEVWLRILDPDGLPIGSAFRADASSTDQRHPRLAALPGGRFAVAWTAPDGDDLGVWIRIYADNGSPMTDAFEVAEQDVGRQHMADLAATANGGFTVIWTTNWDPTVSATYDADVRGRGLDLSVRSFSGDGAPRGPERSATDFVDEHESWAAATTHPAGGAAVLWRAALGQPPNQIDVEIALRAIDENGNPDIMVLTADQATLGRARHLDLSNAPDGLTFAGAWESDGGPGRLAWIQLFDTNLVPMGSALRLDGADRHHRPAVTFIDDTTLVATWATLGAAGPGAVWLQSFAVDPVGPVPLGDPIQVDSGGEWVTSPALSTAADGTVLVTWSGRSSEYGAAQTRGRIARPEVVLSAADVPHGNADIDVQFKWIDGTGVERCSTVAHWFWADPAAATSGEATYPDLFTNALDIEVSGAWEPGPDTQILSVALSERTAPLLAGACDPWGAWTATPYTFPAALSGIAQPDLDPDTTCFQYRWDVTNRARITTSHGSPNEVRVDRVHPVGSFAAAVDHDMLDVTLTCTDVHSGCAPDATVSVAGGVPQLVPSNGASRVGGVIDGAQSVEGIIFDLPGNNEVHRTVVIGDLATPGIDILSIDDGAIYGPDIPLVWISVGGVTDVELTVDGVGTPMVSELIGLADGLHHVVLDGLSNEGANVMDEVQFEVDATVLTAVITAPLPHVHPDDDLVATAWVDDPAPNLLWSLDGGPWQVSSVFENLSDGPHVLQLEATAGGRSGSDEVAFDVLDAVPELTIDEPIAGAVLPSGEVQVLCWSSEPTVTWEVNGRAGSIACGNYIPNDGGDVLPDGPHNLVLTATHTNGNTAREAVSFEIDSTPFDLVVTSPTGGAYGSDDIALTWTTTTDATVTATLDGAVVTSLQGLAAGPHELVVHAVAATGLEDTEVVAFSIVPLSITSPTDGEEVVSTGLPALAPLVYDGGVGCASLSATLDDEDAVGVTAAPGDVTYLATERGPHTLRLTCMVGTDPITDVVDFEIGERNVTPERIRYEYDSCDADYNCDDVTVFVSLRNTGDFDVRDPFEVRFDHLDQAGTPVGVSQRAVAPPLMEGEVTEVAFTSVAASLEHRFVVFVDPDQQIPDQTVDDDYLETRFLAGTLHAPEWVHDADGVFVEGVGLLNGVVAATSGPIANVEVHANGRVFVDDVLEGGTAHALANMGDLTAVQDCIDLYATAVDGTIVDAAAFCPSVRQSAIAPRGHVLPLYRHARNDGRIYMSDLDRETLVNETLEAHQDTMVTNNLPMMPVITDDGEVAYLLMAKGGIPASPHSINMGNLPFGGNWMVPTQMAMFSVLVKPTSGTCTASGVILSDENGLTEHYETKLEDSLNAMAENALDNVDIEELIEDFAPGYWAVGDFPFGTDNFMFAGAVPPMDDLGGFGLYTLGILDFSLEAPEVEIDMLVGDEIRGGFDVTDLCTLDLIDVLLGVNVEARMWAEADSLVNLRIGAQNADLYAVGLPHWEWIPLPMFVGIVDAHLEVHPQSLDIPIHTGFEIEMQLSPLAVDPMAIEATAATSLTTQIPITPLADLSYSAYPLIGLGFGGGQDMRFTWMIDAWSTVRAESAYDFSTQQMLPTDSGGEGRFTIGLDTETRIRVCWLGVFCWWGDWSDPAEQNECHTIGVGDPLSIADPCPCPDPDDPGAPMDRTCFESSNSLPTLH